MLQFVFLRKADTYEKVWETCLEYADNQKVFVPQGQEKQVSDHEQDSSTKKGKKYFTRIRQKKWTSCARSLNIWL